MDQAAALFFSHPFWVWIAIGAVFLIGELMTGSGWLLWPAGAAAVVAVATRVVSLGWPGEIVLFVLVAVAATYVGRRFLRSPAIKAGDADINDPSPRVVGQTGEATEAFKAGQGRVFVDGKEWAAELDGGGDLAAGAKVQVLHILGGARLRVAAA
jgi:membrane protein implicated in regulation of membrane protease activity